MAIKNKSKSQEEEKFLHLVQDEETIAELHQCVLSPNHDYEELAVKWKEWWLDANPLLLDHMMSVCIAFDTATAFAMSYELWDL